MTEFMPSAVYNPANRMPEPKPIPEGMESCDGCNGNGIHYGAGSVVNGVFVGFQGVCFRCRGKGHQTPSDVKRNRYYDNRIRRIPGF